MEVENLMKIKGSEEFKKLNHENQDKILSIVQSGVFSGTMMDYAKRDPRLDVNVKDNTGKMNEITLFVVDILNDDIRPLVSFNSQGKHIIKRKSKNNPDGVFVTLDGIFETQEYKERKKSMLDAIEASEKVEMTKIQNMISNLVKEQELV